MQRAMVVGATRRHHHGSTCGAWRDIAGVDREVVQLDSVNDDLLSALRNTTIWPPAAAGFGENDCTPFCRLTVIVNPTGDGEPGVVGPLHSTAEQGASRSHVLRRGNLHGCSLLPARTGLWSKINTGADRQEHAVRGFFYERVSSFGFGSPNRAPRPAAGHFSIGLFNDRHRAAVGPRVATFETRSGMFFSVKV